MDETDLFRYKYEKYKRKYLLLKKSLQIGGGADIIRRYPTYALYTENAGLPIHILEEILEENKWNKIELDKLIDDKTSRVKEKVDLIYLDFGEDSRDEEHVVMWNKLWDIKCFTKNMLSNKKEIITNKCTIHRQILKKYKDVIGDHIPQTYELSKLPDDLKNKVWIIRPCGLGFFSGHGIIIVSNDDILRGLKNSYINEKSQKVKKELYVTNTDKKKYKNAYVKKIASEYIRNPLTLGGLKCHFRMYMLITLYPKYGYSLCPVGKILTALKPYEDKDFENHDIHDSHMGSTARNYFFPYDGNLLDSQMGKNNVTKEELNDMWNQMNKICGVISKIYEPFAGTYQESQSGFEVFGMDFMADNKCHVFFIEVNDKVGYGGKKKHGAISFDTFSHEYFSWLYENALDPIKYKK